MAETVKLDGAWWIRGLPDGLEDCGPYPTKAYAEEDRRGMLRTIKSKEWKALDDHTEEEAK